MLQVLPKGTEAAEDTKALDSAFAAGETVVVDGDNVQLQQLSFDIPAGSDLTGGAGQPGTAGFRVTCRQRQSPTEAVRQSLYWCIRKHALEATMSFVAQVLSLC